MNHAQTNRRHFREIITISFQFTAGGALTALLLLLSLPSRAVNVTQTIVEATCTEPDYIVTHDADAETSVVENLPALGHAFGDWIADETAAAYALAHEIPFVVIPE